jgi:hypothetical protein
VWVAGDQSAPSPFGHFVVRKEFLTYPASLTPCVHLRNLRIKMDPGSFLDTVYFEQNCFKKQNCSKQNFVLLLPNFFFFVKDFLWTMDRDRNGHDGPNGQEWTAEWTMDRDRNGHVQQVTSLNLSIRPSNGKSIASMMSVLVHVHENE